MPEETITATHAGHWLLLWAGSDEVEPVLGISCSSIKRLRRELPLLRFWSAAPTAARLSMYCLRTPARPVAWPTYSVHDKAPGFRLAIQTEAQKFETCPMWGPVMDKRR